MAANRIDDDYELLSHAELERLREENSRLRQNPFKGRAEPKDLQGSVDHLTQVIQKLVDLFSQTNEEMIKDYKKTSLQQQFANISSQNERIAQGILSVAQMVEELQDALQKNNGSNSSSSQQATTPQEPAVSQPATQQQSSSEMQYSPQHTTTPGQNTPGAVQSPTASQPQEVHQTQQTTSGQDVAQPNNSSTDTAFQEPSALNEPPQPAQSQNSSQGAQPSTQGIDLPPPPPEKKKGLGALFKK